LTVAATPVGVRALNRATLARQLLLERSSLEPLAALEHLVGLQAQTPHSWYVGLWARLRDFDPVAFSTLLEERQVVRIALMRGTIHLVSAADARRLRPVLQSVLDRQLRSNFRRPLEGLDPTVVAAHGASFMERTPRTFGELGDNLLERWPGRDRLALEMAVRALVPLVQVPPRGLWGRSGRVAHTTMDAWLDPAPEASTTVAEVVRRYLGAFGPASIADIGTWSGLAGIAEIVEGLRSDLVVMRDDRGRELFDLPDAPRPEADTPAPVRFLYDYDNLFLSHADRSRVQPRDPYRAIEVRPNEIVSAYLVDGFIGGFWRLRQERASPTHLDLRPIIRLTKAQEHEVATEGERLLSFLAADSSRADITFDRGSG
jgi:hypothetical protein